MDEPSEDEKMEMQGCTAVAMHLEANERFGKISATIITVAVIVSIFTESFWPVAIGVVVSFLVSYFIRQSCFRYLERSTGMPTSIQSHFLLRYKSDKEFAARVDAMHKNASSISRGG